MLVLDVGVVSMGEREGRWGEGASQGTTYIADTHTHTTTTEGRRGGEGEEEREEWFKVYSKGGKLPGDDIHGRDRHDEHRGRQRRRERREGRLKAKERVGETEGRRKGEKAGRRDEERSCV